MKAMLVPCGEMPRIVEIDGLEDMQKAVGGFIEPCPWVFSDKPSVYVNEEGKFTCPPNRAVYATEGDEGNVRWDGSKVKRGDLLDVLYGDILCVGFDAETGEDRDITDEEVECVMRRFGTRRSIESGMLEVLCVQFGAKA